MDLRLNAIGLTLLALLTPAALALGPALAGEAKDGQRASLDAEVLKTTIETLAGQVEADYFEPGLGAQVASRLRTGLAHGRYGQVHDLEALATLATSEMYTVAKDKHLSLVVAKDRPPRPAPAAGPARETREARGRREHFGFQRVEILPGNIGYLRVTAFYRPEETRDVMAEAMAFLSQADALIVDLRDHGGGATPTVARFTSYFLDGQDMPLFAITPRPPDAPRPYRTEGPSLAHRDGHRPTFLLTSPRTSSGGEGVAFLLQERHRAVVIGERTWGGANQIPPAWPVNRFFEANIPNGRMGSALTGRNWEGTGVSPDVPVSADQALPVAQAMALLARAKEAQGGRAWDQVTALRSIGTLETSGLAGTVDVLEDLATGANVTRADLGVVRQTEGFDGSQAWIQDSSGTSTVKGDAQARQDAANGAYLASRAYWYPERWPAAATILGPQTEGGRAYLALSILPRGGRAFELWVDEVTGLLDRQVTTGGGVTETTRFGDYRPWEDLKLAFSVRTGNGQAAFDQVARYERIVKNEPLPPGTFAVPPPPPPDCGFEGGAKETTLPMDVDEDGHIYVQAVVRGQGPRWLCLDTGAEAAALTPSAVKAMGLRGQGAVQAGGVGEQSEQAQAVQVERLQLGAAWLRDQTFWAIPGLEGIGDVRGEPCAGVLGSNLFKRFVVRLDYGRRTVTLIRPGVWHPPAAGVTVPFVFKRSIPLVEGSLDGIPGPFTLDTGSGSTLDVCAPFVAQHGLVAKAAVLYPMAPSGGIGGACGGFDTRAHELKLGALTLKDPLVGLSTQKAGAFADPGTIGNLGGRFFRRFVVTFDYPHQIVHFQPGAHSFDRGLWTLTSGLRVQAGAGTASITAVLPHSPAQEQGLLPGDQILEVNGHPVGDLKPGQLGAQLNAPAGTALALKVRSGDRERSVALTLRDLL